MFRFLVLFTLISPIAVAKPLVPHSEETAARRCLSYEETPERGVNLCHSALAKTTLTDRERTQLLIALSEDLRDLKRYEEAETAAREAMALSPLSPNPINEMGWVLWVQNREAEAIPLFRKSVELRPTGGGYAGLASTLARGSGHVDDAMKQEIRQYFDLSLAIDPYDRWTLRERGWILRWFGQAEDAVESFNAAIKINDGDANAHYGASRSLQDLGRFEEALLAINRSIEADGGTQASFVQRASVLRSLDRNAQAISDADEAIRLAPSASGGHVEKAMALAALGRRGDAFTAFEAGIAQGADDNHLLYWYADVLSDDGQFDKALNTVDAAIEKAGSDDNDLILKAYIANELGRYDTALEAAEIAVEKNPATRFGHYHAAVALLGQGDMDSGLQRFDRAMRAGLPQELVGTYAARLISEGKLLAAIELRRKY